MARDLKTYFVIFSIIISIEIAAILYLFTDNLAIGIATFAACIASIGLLLHLVNEIVQVNVECQIDEEKREIVVKIKNIGNKSITLSKGGVTTERKFIDFDEPLPRPKKVNIGAPFYTLLEVPNITRLIIPKFPKSLQGGQSYTISRGIIDVVILAGRSEINESGILRIAGCFQDQLDNKYYSNYFEIPIQDYIPQSDSTA